MKYLKVIIGGITGGYRGGARDQAGLIVSELTMIDDNGSRLPYRAAACCTQRRSTFASLRARASFERARMCEPLCVRDCFFGFAWPDGAILKANRAPCAQLARRAEGIYFVQQARYHLRGDRLAADK